MQIDRAQQRRARTRAWCGIITCALALDAASAATPRPNPPDAQAATLRSIDIVIDAKARGRVQLLERTGLFYASEAQFKQWQLPRRTNARGISHQGALWYPLALIPEVELVHYFRENRLEIRTPNAPPSTVAEAPAELPPVPESKSANLPAASPAPPSKATNSQPAAAATIETGAPRLMPLEVSINGAKSGNWLLLERDGILYAPAEAFEEWRLNRKPDAKSTTYRKQTWFPLSAVPGFSAQLNAADQSMDLKFQSGAFAATKLTQAPAERPALTPALTSAFLNYDFSYTASDIDGIDTTQDLGMLGEIGLSSSLGVLTTSYVGRNLTGQDSATPRSGKRLETTFARDFPERNMSLRLGDSARRAGMWGRTTYYGGVQLTRNFSLTPGFISQPIPPIQGLSTSPSTVELYINDALRQTSQVPAGPFVIDNFPLLTGGGQARVVVRDVLGRETVLVQDFFSHSDLLEKGLSDWSLDVGAVRRNIGVRSADYGRAFSAGLYRYGLSQNVTMETNLEAAPRAFGGGVGLSVALPFQVLGQIAAAGSDMRSVGSGYQWLAGLEHSSLKHGFSLRAEGASRDYRQVSEDAGTAPYRHQLSASYTYAAERLGHIGLGYARITTYDRGPLESYSANYSHRIGRRGTVSFLATHAEGESRGQSYAVTLLLPFDRDIVGSASVNHRGNQTDAYVSASKAIGTSTGLGWRVLSGVRDERQAYGEAGLYYQGSKGLLSADLSGSDTQKTARLGAQGGLVAIDWGLYAARKIENSYALVEVPGYANIGVGFQSSVLARTDKSGKALVPRLLPYRTNSIRLDPGELPISAELDSIEQVVVPAARSGVKVAFPVRSGRGALIKIRFDDGQPAPAGAPIELLGDKQEFYVARRGEAFITGLQPKNTLVLKWNDQQCRMTVDLPPGKNDEIARLGPIVCKGIKRE